MATLAKLEERRRTAHVAYSALGGGGAAERDGHGSLKDQKRLLFVLATHQEKIHLKSATFSRTLKMSISLLNSSTFSTNPFTRDGRKCSNALHAQNSRAYLHIQISIYLHVYVDPSSYIRLSSPHLVVFNQLLLLRLLRQSAFAYIQIYTSIERRSPACRSLALLLIRVIPHFLQRRLQLLRRRSRAGERAKLESVEGAFFF